MIAIIHTPYFKIAKHIGNKLSLVNEIISLYIYFYKYLKLYYV